MAIQSSADLLNSQYEILGKTFDNFFSQISKTAKNTIQKVLSDWQDFYYAEENYGNNPNVDKWIKVHSETNKLLNSAITKRHLKPIVPKEAIVKETIVIEEPSVIFGRLNIPMLVGLLTGGAAIGFVGYNSFKRNK